MVVGKAVVHGRNSMCDCSRTVKQKNPRELDKHTKKLVPLRHASVAPAGFARAVPATRLAGQEGTEQKPGNRRTKRTTTCEARRKGNMTRRECPFLLLGVEPVLDLERRRRVSALRTSSCQSRRVRDSRRRRKRPCRPEWTSKVRVGQLTK
jgi:hypothetical protein